MNAQEQAFYQFLTTLPEAVFDQWLELATVNELMLADHVFDQARFGGWDPVESVAEANQLLKQFTLKG